MSSWFGFNSTKSTEEIQAPDVCFIGEQDGVPERRLKERLSEFFGTDRSVTAAYLVRVQYPDSTSIALCLRSASNAQSHIVDEVGGIFRSMFGPQEHLDIIFLTARMESELVTVCRPFFEAV